MSGIAESSMRDSPGTAVELGVKALDERDLVGLLAVQEVPFVILVWEHSVCLAVAGRVDERHADEVGVRDRVGVRDGEWILEDRFDWSPDVDDLVAGLEETIGFVGEMVWDA